jgi:hypothetical protein
MIKETREQRKAREKEEAKRLADETLARMKERSDARKEAIRETTESWTFEKLMTLVMIAITFIIFYVGITTITTANGEKAQYTRDIESLKNEILDIRAEIDRTIVEPIDTELVIDTLNNAHDIGAEVANAQNTYKDLYKRVDTAASETDLVLALDDITAHAKDCEKYFTTTEPRKCWYEVTNVDYEWVFESSYDFSGESMPVLWTCRDKATGELLAYATGVYNVVSGEFGNVELAYTLKGKEYKGELVTAGETDTNVFGDEEVSTDTDASQDPVTGVDPVTTPSAEEGNE